MSNLKYYNDSTGQWEYLVIGKQGPTGETGAQGPAGLDGNDGALSTNYVINGNFSVNQRQVISSTPSVASGRVIDRWTLRSRNVGTHDVSLLENEDIADLGRSNAIKISNFFDSAWIGQRIELNTHSFLSEQDVTVSFYAKADNPISDLRVFLHANSDGGTHGSPYFTTAQPVGTTWERYSFTMTIGTLANDQANSSLLLGFGQQNTDTTFYLSGVQLELGTVATPFKQRPYHEELEMCRRYYQKISALASYAVFGLATVYTDERVYGSIPLLTSMRAAPSVSVSGNIRGLYPGGVLNMSPGDSTNLAAYSSYHSTSAIGVRGGAYTPTLDAYHGAAILIQANNDSTAYIQADSEL